MKKIIYLMAALTVMIGLAACNQQSEVKNKDAGKEKTNVTDVTTPKKVTAPQKVTKPKEKAAKPAAKKEVKKQETPKQTVPREQKRGTQTVQKAATPKVPKTAVYKNEAFKDVVVTESGNKMVVTGKAQVFEGMFDYSLYDGNKKLFEKSYQTDGAPAWGNFRITFDKKLVSTNQIKFQLFDYSAKDSSKVHLLEIPIPKKQ